MRHETFPDPFARAAQRETYLKAGHWFRAAFFDDPKSRGWCEKNKVEIRAAAGENTNTGGGFLVPTEIENAIISQRALSGVFRREATVRPVGSDERVLPRRVSGITTGYTSENIAAAESSAMTFDGITVTPRKLTALCYISSELYEDEAVGLGQWFVEEIGNAFGSAEDDAGFNGDGSPTYGNQVGATKILIDGAHTAGAISATSGNDTFAELTAADLGACMAALPEQYLDGACWFASSYAIGNTFARLGMLPAGMMTDKYGRQRPMFTYAGFPIIATPKLPGSGDQSNKVMLLFGDLKQAATLGDRRGIDVRVSAVPRFEYDQLAVKGRERFEVICHDLGDTSTAGALVGLVGN